MTEHARPSSLPISFPPVQSNLNARESVIRFIRLMGDGRTDAASALGKPMERHGREVRSEIGNDSRLDLRRLRPVKRRCEELMRKSSPGSRYALSSEAQLKVLESICRYGKRTHANRLSAALAIEYGLEKGRLIPALNAACFLKRKHHGIYDGEITTSISAAHRDLFSLVNVILLIEGKALSSREIAIKVGLDPTTKNINLVSHTNGILDLIGITRKLPVDQNANGFRWIHRAYAFSRETIPVWNMDWQILQRLRAGRRMGSELVRHREIFGRNYGAAGGLTARTQTVAERFLKLLDSGLISVRKLSGSGMSAEFTGFALCEMKKADERGYLGEELRKALLGNAKSRAERDLNPEDAGDLRSRTLQRIWRAAFAWRAFDDMRSKLRREGVILNREFAGAREAARTIGEDHKYIINVVRGKSPWNGIRPEMMASVYIPLLKRIDRRLADWLAARLGLKNVRTRRSAD